MLSIGKSSGQGTFLFFLLIVFYFSLYFYFILLFFFLQIASFVYLIHLRGEKGHAGEEATICDL